MILFLIVFGCKGTLIQRKIVFLQLRKTTKMQQVYTIPSGRNALSESGILRVYHDAFSSKNRYGTTFTSDYDQGCFIVFECCSFPVKVNE